MSARQRWLKICAIVVSLFIGWANELPEELYNRTPEDDAAIGKLLDAHPAFLKIPVAMDPVAFPVADSKETLSIKPCVWSKMAVYGLEFLSAGSGTLLSHFALYPFNDRAQWTNGPAPWFSGSVYALLTTATTSGTIFLTGGLLNQKGNLQKAMIGAGMASIFVSFIEYNYHRFGIEYCLLPPYGAIIGYNWDRDKFFRQAGIYSLEFMGGCVGWGLVAIPSVFCYGLIYEYEHIRPKDLIPLYTIPNMLFTSTTTAIVGKLYKQKGSWLRAALGAGAGAVLSLVAFDYFELRSRASNGYYSPPRIVEIAVSLLPPTGALIGYNFH